MLLYLQDKLRLGGKTTFSHAELSLILGLYGDGVKRGIWRDYAIDCLSDMAVFSVYKSARDKPTYSIAKIPPKNVLKSAQYAIYENGKTVRDGASLSDVLAFFNEEK